MVPAFAVKLAVVADAATVTEAGTVSSVLLSDRATERPAVGAAALSVTVQVLLALEVNAWGVQVRLLKVTGAVKAIEALVEVPLAVAVTVTVLAVVTVEAVTVNVAVLLAAATVTEAGVVSNELLSASVTTVPPVGATALSVTVHVLLALEARD